MFCKKCGRELAEGSAFCPYCGTKQFENQYSQPENSNQYQTYNYNYNSFAPSGAAQKDIETTKVLGIVALVVGLFMPIVGFICGGIGISKVNKLKTVAFEEQKAELNKNKKLCIAGIIVPAVITVLSLIISIAFGIAAGRKIADGIANDYDGGAYSYSFDADEFEDEIEDNIEDYFKQYGIDIDE